MSYYKALQAFGIDDAIEKVRIETQKAALINKQNNAKFARMPFVFTMYRMGVKKHMAKNFPPEGWKTEWVRCDGKEIHFNLHSCLYHDICVEKGCPELCRVYCENDNIAFPGLCRRYALKEQERSVKAQLAAIFILLTQKSKPIKIESYVI